MYEFNCIKWVLNPLLIQFDRLIQQLTEFPMAMAFDCPSNHLHDSSVSQIVWQKRNYNNYKLADTNHESFHCDIMCRMLD